MDQPRTHRLSGYGVSESVVRIQGRETGAGVVISPRHIATCAHVMLDALGLSREQTTPPQDTAGLQVRVWDVGVPRQPAVNILPQWRPVDSGDIVLLELDPDEPDLLPACSRVIGGDEWPRQTLDTFGYPEGFDTGQIARLECHSAVANRNIQCSPVREGLSGGYSGGPAFSADGELLGIARAMRRFRDPTRKYDYLIPITQVLELLPEFAGPLRQPYYSLSLAMADEAHKQLANWMSEARGTPPHDVTEYRLQRRLRDWETRDIRLDFTPLLLLLEEKRRSEFGDGPPPVEYHNLNQVLKHECHPVFLLKGAPGGGKTTILKRLAFDLCVQDEDGLPILVELGRHKGSESPGAWLARDWHENFPNMPQLTDLSRDRRILWLLDGLNELPDEPGSPRQEKIADWRDWLATQNGRHRAIISCRSADYLDELDEVGGEVVPHLELQPLDLVKIGEFLHNRSTLTPQQAEDAVERIENRDLVRLYNTPLMLTLLEQVLSPEGDFPDGRADLFSAYLFRLVDRELKKRASVCDGLFTVPQRKYFAEAVRPGSGAPGQADWRLKLVCRSNPLFDVLSEQAYRRQRAVYRGERQEVSFDRLELEDALHESNGETQGEQILQAALALNLLVTTEDEHSLRFRHQQFQEFFAARYLSSGGDLALAQAPHRPEEFRQDLQQVRGNMQPWQELPPVDRSGWEETTLMAAELATERDTFIDDLAEFNLPLAGQCAANLAPRINRFLPLAEQLLTRMRDAGSDLRARIAAGKALGEMQALEVLGYQSLKDSSGRRIAWLPPVETIPGGEYRFGSRDDPEAYEDEHPFSRRLETFRLGRYPLSNTEWACFMQDGGYNNPDLWQGEASINYRQHGSVEGQILQWQWWRDRFEDESIDKYLAQSSMDLETREWVRQTVSSDSKDWEAHLEKLRSQAQPVTEPDQWRVSRFNNLLQPVVGISLFEALAYCRWLSELTGERYSLPDELQWEAAARGSGSDPRRYAWGDRFTRDVCNSRDEQDRLQVGAITPVGLYDEGRTPDAGLYDLTGNIWEWTRSVYREQPPYDTDPLDSLEDAGQSRVVRGGSWGSDLRALRAAYRDYGSPDCRDYGLGCRVCLLPPLKPET